MSTRAEADFRFSRAFRGWWWLLGRDAGRVMPVAVAWAALQFILHQADQALGLASGVGWLSTAMIVEPLFAGTLFVMALSDDAVAPGEAFGAALNRFVPLLVLHVLTALGIAVGLILLVLPGIALAVLWTIAFPILTPNGRARLTRCAPVFQQSKVASGRYSHCSPSIPPRSLWRASFSAALAPPTASISRRPGWSSMRSPR